MFNPKGRTERDSEEWAIEALRGTRNGNLQYVVILGILGSVAIVPFAGVPMGIFSFVCCLMFSLSSASKSQHSQAAVHEFGCFAHALEGSKFHAFRAQVGDEEIVAQCQWARENGYPLSSDASEFLAQQKIVNIESVSMTSNTSEEYTSLTARLPDQPEKAKSATVPNLRGDMSAKTQFSKQIPNLTRSIAENLKNTLIVGVPGVGKDLFLSNVLRDVRSLHPKATIFFIDPKADPKEVGYFDGCVDYPFHMNIAEESPQQVCDWVCECLEEFESFDAGTELKILCFGEIAATMKLLGTIKGAAQLLKAKFVSYSSSGDSRGIKFIASSQNAHTDGIGFNGGERSIFTPIVLISAAQIPASEQILKAQIISSDKRLSSTELETLCKKSPVGRAIYHGGFNQWFPMPELPNYSGYNRDTRSFSNQQTALLAKLEATQETTVNEFVTNELGLSGDKAEKMLTAVAEVLEQEKRKSLIAKFKSNVKP
ncbi:MAG: hypothetical protein KME60_13465 [Cyanomargarita calcarea GSE-NOS-MK-12-04C]|uniref:Uncharacterized protein n=1 Tax=Cyanomargarita calcarea GSE-NOS-MK-12-04C TaxID=2839659 RepID=A0A951UT41_9CYAN|nr:hypothetical protein [Cyanomargarita calcarea GSE-NOS-MK-12-04C]